MIVNVCGRTRDGIRLFAGHKSGQGKGYLELSCVDGDLHDRQNVSPDRDFHQEELGLRVQSDWLRASDPSVSYGGIDDKARGRGYVFRNVGLVDWRATKREEGGGGRGWDWELTTRGNDWGSFLVVLIAPVQRYERGDERYAKCDRLLTISLARTTNLPIQRGPTNTGVEPSLNEEKKKMATRRTKGATTD